MRRALLAWYDAEQRDLPWRGIRDPYAIWVSEIMLQQTRVAAVIGHYQRFLRSYPTVLALSLAPLDDVLAAWSGLGYYRRARMLHLAAKVIVAEHAGQLPASHEDIRRLPGIGVYTSAAVASIAFQVPVAAVDGNVERVLARITGQPGQRGAAQWRTLAKQLLDVQRPGDFNQAMMELGAQICTPRVPRCTICPLYKWCRTRGEHPTQPRQQLRSMEVALALVQRNSMGGAELLLQRRPDSAGQMAGMWEMPQLARSPKADPPIVVRHSITNTNYYVRVFVLTEEASALSTTLKAADGERAFRPVRDLATLPLTGLTLKILRRAGILQTA